MTEPQSEQSGSKWMMTLAILTWTACDVALVCDVVGWMIVNPITETISKLAVGKYAWDSGHRP